MNIQILQVAASKNPAIKTLEQDFEKRLRPFAKLEILTVPASKSDQRAAAQSQERDLLLKKLDTKAKIIALDERGAPLTSEEFAALIKETRDFGPGHIQFIIGGSHGLHPDILEAAHQKISLSKMTFTHEMVRVFLKEQIYRAFTILAGKRYHK